MAEVTALAGWPPEVLAYAYATYSRSSLSIRESIKKITSEGSSKFLETFYFQYGHRSIADNAHIPLALENVSEIAAFKLEDEQLWDGQERSTRFQNFESGAYYTPSSVRGTPLEPRYTRVADLLLEQYAFFSTRCFEHLVKTTPRPAEMRYEDYERALRARAFDVARYWLFNGMLTSVGQITSARTLESQISRLMSSEYPELRELGQKMKDACTQKPFSPEGRDEPPVAPTLAKYTNPNVYQIELRSAMRCEVERLAIKQQFMWLPYDKLVPYVKLAPAMTLEDEIVATLLYEASHCSYNSVIDFMYQSISRTEKQRIIELALKNRGTHDPVPKAFASGHQIQFDVVMDRGGERDLHRHRNCIQIHQGLTTEWKWDTPKMIHQMGFADVYNAGMAQAGEAVRELRKEIGVDADYLLPFGYRSATLYKMHLAEAAYIIELRSRPQGHFSYREVACQMHNQMVERWPMLNGKIRVTPFEQSDLLIR